ncbi:hypothetical protein EJ03DRAFT_192336 [Teratosphaeria nubilosa]|uniref:Uncharacterized protein n=1 Tax=Teratosphaeria nubilosa TaxID=161662 RepID=A0A6G1KZI3_9PEZI|nr:hypothetical protein EJ03DRAFT_192336 [Teratosphaeria nubilosa]
MSVSFWPHVASRRHDSRRRPDSEELASAWRASLRKISDHRYGCHAAICYYWYLSPLISSDCRMSSKFELKAAIMKLRKRVSRGSSNYRI